MKDRLFLLRPGFEDPASPGQLFYCWHCAILEGLLASFPLLALVVEVERIAWAKPRGAVIDLVGDGDQSLPLLVLTEGSGSTHETSRHHGLGLVQRLDAILAYLSERHGIPVPHP